MDADIRGVISGDMDAIVSSNNIEKYEEAENNDAQQKENK